MSFFLLSLHFNICKNCEFLWVLFMQFKFSSDHPYLQKYDKECFVKQHALREKQPALLYKLGVAHGGIFPTVHISNCSTPWFMTPFQGCSKPSTQHERWAGPKHAYTKSHLHNNHRVSQNVGSFPLNVSACSAIILHLSITKKKCTARTTANKHLRHSKLAIIAFDKGSNQRALYS